MRIRNSIYCPNQIPKFLKENFYSVYKLKHHLRQFQNTLLRWNLVRKTAIKKGWNKLVVLFIQNSDIYKEVKNMSSTMNYQLNTSDEQIAQYCTKNGIKKLSFFGSVLTDKFTSESDIDILVEFEDEKIPGLLALTRMERELSELFGRNVDLKTPAELSSYFRSEVVKEAEVKYG